MTMGIASSALVPHLFLFFILLFSFSSAAVDFISRNQSLIDGQTMVSPGERFELGFFSPKSSKNRYVGIWYKNIPVQTVVWVANRENPVTDSSGILSVDGNGNLVVLDGNRRILWSCNASVVLKNSTAVIQDSGNLVLQEEATGKGQTRILWQSFENPSDTFLPIMKIGVDLTTGKRQYLTSWTSESDPSPGLISAGVELRVLQLPQLFCNNGSRRIWRSGYWNGQIFIGVRDMISSPSAVKLSADYQQRKIYVSYPSYHSSFIARLVVDWTGSFTQRNWHDDTKKWSVEWIQLEKPCDFYGTCGPFGSCDSSKPTICGCLQGFKPKSVDEWGRGYWTSGCVRRTQLQCKQGENTTTGDATPDGFWKIGGVKLPDFADWQDVNATDCKEVCFSNCSCVAFTHVSGIGCMLWASELIDIQQMPSGGVDLFIRLAGSEIDETRSSRLWITILAVLGAAIFSTLASLLLWRWTAKHRGKNKAGVGKHTKLNAGAVENTVEQVGVLELPLFDFDAIETATKGFSDANKLGEGGYGPVYKGTLKDGQEIAVKRLSRSSGQGLEEFKNEVGLLSKLQHRNLVRLLGCCVEGDEKMLVYEYMRNKSLDAFLFDPYKRGLLDWVRRFYIVEGIARGLLYLHRDSRLRIIHRDLKTSNILLDNEMNPKISDFGMARIFAGNQTPTNTNRVVGTYGYMAPEYAMQGRFSEKSDVFSFGVVMLEIVSGRRNTGFYNDSHLNLIGYAWSLWNEDKALQLVDPSLGDSFSTLEVMRCIHVGLLCLQERETERPTLSSVVLMLGEAACLPMPGEPAFSFAPPGNSTPSHGEICSANEVTITSLKGR